MAYPPIPREAGLIVANSVNVCPHSNPDCLITEPGRIQELDLNACNQEEFEILNSYYEDRLGDSYGKYVETIRCVDTSKAFLNSRADSPRF